MSWVRIDKPEQAEPERWNTATLVITTADGVKWGHRLPGRPVPSWPDSMIWQFVEAAERRFGPAMQVALVTVRGWSKVDGQAE